ncbi:MAG: LAGLIDADG family homing endonuclease [Patescibacteria group bacterium]
MMRCSAFEQNENHSLHKTPTPNITKSYLLGLIHDSTTSRYTYRLCQKSLSFLESVQRGIQKMGSKAWIYKEGKSRNVYILEFAKSLLKDSAIASPTDKIDYIRGYFDAEGSVPRNLLTRYYIYFCQKDFNDLEQVRNYLLELGIECGKIHIPSISVDPNYYRFYILCNSWEKFGRFIGSFHNEKGKFVRMKI